MSEIGWITEAAVTASPCRGGPRVWRHWAGDRRPTININLREVRSNTPPILMSEAARERRVPCHLEDQSVAGEPGVGKISRRVRRDRNEKPRHVVTYLNHDGTLVPHPEIN
jgi:hypothetical protein